MELVLDPNGPYLILEEPTEKLMRERPELKPLLSRATALFYLQSKGWQEAVQVFEDAQVEPPPEWLREIADAVWASRYMYPGIGRDAIRLLARAGDVARLNEIGESLSCCHIDEEAFDAFFAAGNVQRIREVGEHYLRQGYDEGLHGFELIQETPSRELLEAFARALVTRARFPHRMLRVVKAAGIRLPRTFLLEAAERYRRRIGDCTRALLEIADDEPQEGDEGASTHEECS